MPSDPVAQTTPGRALWELDRPLSDFPKRKPWEAFEPRERERYEMRAADILSTAAKIMEKARGERS